MRNARKTAAGGLLAGLTATLLVMAVSQTRAWRGFEERAQGVLVARHGPLPWNPQVVVVDFDEASLRRLQPMPRALIARVLAAVDKAGARAVGFDMLFRSTASVDGQQGDLALADAARGFGRTVFMLECANDGPPPDAEQLAAFARSASSAGQVPAFGCDTLSLPYGPIRDSGRLAHVILGAFDSSNSRGFYGFVEAGGKRMPSLAVAVYAAGQGLPSSAVGADARSLSVGGRRLALDERGRVLATFRGLPPKGVVSFLELAEAVGLQGPIELPPALAERLRGRYVLFGYSAPTQADVGPLITGQRIPYVAIHAAMISDLLEGRSLREVPRAVELLLLLLGGLLMSLAAVRLSARNAVLALVAWLVALFAVAARLVGLDLLLGPLGPAVASTMALAAAMSVRLGAGDRERRLLTHAFGSYVHPAVLKRILDDPSGTLSLAGAQKTVSVLFSDIQGYTRATNRDPQQVLGLVRDYMAEMTALVVRREGRVDKIMGDGLLAVFGDPIAASDHSVRAVETALEMQSRLVALNAQWAAQGRPPVTIRVGVATGEVFVGNVGAEAAKIEYTVLGPAVNLAARLQAKADAGGVLVSEQTRAGCGERFRFEEVDGLELKGFDAPTTAWKVTAR